MAAVGHAGVVDRCKALCFSVNDLSILKFGGINDFETFFLDVFSVL